MIVYHYQRVGPRQKIGEDDLGQPLYCWNIIPLKIIKEQRKSIKIYFDEKHVADIVKNKDSWTISWKDIDFNENVLTMRYALEKVGSLAEYV